jgi:hypothetical protein
MPRVPNRLAGPVQLTNADATYFTAPASGGTPNGGGAIVRHIHVTNPSAGAVTFTLAIGTTATAANRLYDAFSIAAGGLLDVFCYYVLGPGETLHAFAGVTLTLDMTLDGDLIYVG